MGGNYQPAQYTNISGYSQNQYGSSPDYKHRYSNLPGYYHRSPSPRYRPPANQHYPKGYHLRHLSTPPWPYENTGPRPSGPCMEGRSQSPEAQVRAVSEEQETILALNLMD